MGGSGSASDFCNYRRCYHLPVTPYRVVKCRTCNVTVGVLRLEGDQAFFLPWRKGLSTIFVLKVRTPLRSFDDIALKRKRGRSIDGGGLRIRCPRGHDRRVATDRLMADLAGRPPSAPYPV